MALRSQNSKISNSDARIDKYMQMYNIEKKDIQQRTPQATALGDNKEDLLRKN